MKKILLSVIALALVLTSFVWPSETVHPIIKAGVGNGTNGVVKDFEEFLNVLNYAKSMNGFSKDVAINDHSNVVATSAVFASDKSSEIISGTGLSGITIQVESSENVFQNLKKAIYEDVFDSEPTYQNIGEYSFNGVWRYTVYMTQDSIYMVSYSVGNGNLRYFSSQDGESKVHGGIKDIEFYGDSERTLVKYHNWYDSEEKYIPKDNLWDQWFELPREYAYEVFVSYYSHFKSLLSGLTSFLNGFSELNFDMDAIEEAIEESGGTLTQQGNKYIITDDEEKTLMSIDFTYPESPTIEVKQDKNKDGDKTFLNGSVTFTNINNTEIKTNFRDVIYIDDVEEFIKKYARLKEDE